MNNTIDNISVNKDFWIGIQAHVTSFRFLGMQEDVHFSIAYNDNSPDINFHVTKNVNTLTGKPKLEIARINKKELEKIEPHLIKSMLNLILKPVQLKSFGRRSKYSHYGILYYSLERSKENKFNKKLEKELLNGFASISILKKNRLKIKGDIESRLDDLLNKNDITNAFHSNVRWMPRNLSKSIENGIIISKKFTGYAIYLNKRWYALRQDIKLEDFLFTWMGSDLARSLIFKTLMAYSRIKNIASMVELKGNPTSIRLYKTKSV